MKKAIIIVVIVFLSATYAYAEKEENGRYVVKNAKVPFATIKNKVMSWESEEELIKIDTATGRVWKWAEVLDSDNVSRATEWEELKKIETPTLKNLGK